MKKIAKYLFAALATMTAMSCVKELNVEKPVELTGKAYEFTATIGAETKTTLDAETMTPMWLGDRSGNEYITVMEPKNLNTYVAEGIYEPTAEVTFVMAENGGAGLTGKTVFAVSPAEAAVDCFNNADSVGVTVNYNNTQYAYPETYDPAGPVAVAYNADVEANPHFDFKNVSALLKFGIMDGSDPVKSVKIYALGGEKIAGAMHLVTKGEDSYIIPADTLATNWVEMLGLYESELDVETDYYIAVAPALLEKGIGIQFNNNEIQTYTISTELDIKRNRIYDLGVFSYDNQDDNNWYVVGNFAEGNVNSVTKTMFVASGNNLVAKNVSFEAGQSFKIYNPYLGETLYANVGEVETDTWLDLTEGNGYTYPDEGVYDIYIDYVDKVITGVALVSVGAAAPEYLVPEGQYTWVDESSVRWGGSPYGKVIEIDLETAEVQLGTYYDDLMIDQEAEYLDPTMVGKYSAENYCTNVVAIPTHATAGQLTMQAIETPMWGGDPYVAYYIVEYSNLNSTGVNLYSAAQMYDKDGNEIPVLDENGEQVGTWEDWDWDGVAETFSPTFYGGLGGLSLEVNTEDFYGFVPVTAELSETYLEITGAVPTTGQFLWFHMEGEYGEEGYVEYERIFDLGVTEENVIRIAANYDQLMMDSETGELVEWADPRLEGTWLTEYRFDNYEIVQTSATTGEIRIYNEVETLRGTATEYFLIYYSGYTYKSAISLHSPFEILDAEGNPIPVEGTDAYWQGLGLEAMNWMTGMMGAVNMQEASWSYPSVDIVDAPTTPDGAQWFFEWEDMGNAPAALDFGVTAPGQFGIVYDAAAVYGEENLPAEMIGLYMWYMGWEYEIEATDSTSGVVYVKSVDHFGDVITSPIGSYTDYTGASMIFTSEMLYMDNVTMFIGQPVDVYVEQTGGGAL